MMVKLFCKANGALCAKRISFELDFVVCTPLFNTTEKKVSELTLCIFSYLK